MEKNNYKKRRYHFCDLLRHEREVKHLTQEDVAKRMGVRQDLVSKIEKGIRRIDILEMIDYSYALGFTLTEFAKKIDSRLYAENLLKKPKKQRKE